MSQMDALKVVADRLDRVVDSFRIDENTVEVEGFIGGDAVIFRIRRTADGYTVTEK